MSRIAVIGAGVSGLISAYRLAERGHTVTVFEREREPGGLAASFRVGEVVLDRNFHFICPPDAAYLKLLDDLCMLQELHWAPSTMGVFREGEYHRFGTPASLVTFSPLGVSDRARFALATLRARSRARWDDLDGLTAREWLIAEQGERCYDVVWRPLLESKFGTAADDVSAAWMWARINRVAHSRRGLLGREHLGYLAGGTSTLVRALVDRIVASGGEVRLSEPVEAVMIEDERATGVRSSRAAAAFDAVVSTVAPPLLAELAPGLPEAYRDMLGRVEYLGVACWSILSRVPVSRDFWLNISDPRVEFPGVITYTRLDPMPGLGGLHLHYIPVYLPADGLTHAATGDASLPRVLRSLDVIRPGFSAEVEEARVFVERWAQPVYRVGYARQFASLMPGETPVPGLFRADMSQVYPHDRSIVNAAAHALALADAVGSHADGILP